MWRYKTDRLGNPNPAVQRRVDKVGTIDLNSHEARGRLGYCFLEWNKFASVSVPSRQLAAAAAGAAAQARNFSKVSRKMLNETC